MKDNQIYSEKFFEKPLPVRYMYALKLLKKAVSQGYKYAYFKGRLNDNFFSAASRNQYSHSYLEGLKKLSEICTYIPQFKEDPVSQNPSLYHVEKLTDIIESIPNRIIQELERKVKYANERVDDYKYKISDRTFDFKKYDNDRGATDKDRERFKSEIEDLQNTVDFLSKDVISASEDLNTELRRQSLTPKVNAVCTPREILYQLECEAKLIYNHLSKKIEVMHYVNDVIIGDRKWYTGQHDTTLSDAKIKVHEIGKKLAEANFAVRSEKIRQGIEIKAGWGDGTGVPQSYNPLWGNLKRRFSTSI